MTKTQLKKQTTKRVINHLISEFDAYNIDRENQYFDFWADIDGFEIQLQMDTRDYSVASWDSVTLVGDSWTEEQRGKQYAATVLEDRMNESIRELVAS